MTRRILTGLIAVLYLSVAVVLAMLHHHDAGRDDCAACAWRINGTSDTPVSAAVPVVVAVATSNLPAFEPVTPLTPFLPSTASRAPPELV